MEKAQYWIDGLSLNKHPEGGWYKEIYRSNEVIPLSHLPSRFSGDRTFATSIFFLLEGNDFSTLHRIKADEIWHFYEGSSLEIVSIDDDGNLEKVVLGRNLLLGEKLQYVVPQGHWFGARVLDSSSYSLVGCGVAPGFDFEDFEMGDRPTLFAMYPSLKTVIDKYTR
ncbi:MAG: cupin domain-containing protein [Bacteroidetes bacterium]|nr:cupin domain-containing protein [Bacteroidota bacterium]